MNSERKCDLEKDYVNNFRNEKKCFVTILFDIYFI